jgi:hypothetical protein
VGAFTTVHESGLEKPMRPRAQRYRGYVITPHSAQVANEQLRSRLWTVGVFVRTVSQREDQNRYFQLRGCLVSTKTDALKESLSYGKRLVDHELLSIVARFTGGQPGGKRYRRARDSLTWHFSQQCSFWPGQDYLERRIRPAQSVLCNECLALDAANKR